MRFVTDQRSLQEYTAFLTGHERCNFQQSPEWARVKSNWKNEIILAEDGAGNIIGSLSVLIRRMPLFGNLMYSARGPVCDVHDENALRQLMEGAELLGMKYNAMALRMEPDVAADDEDFRAVMTALGCRFRPVRTARDCIQPSRVFRLDIRGKSPEQVLAGFPQKLRYNIRLAQRRGVVVREGRREDLAAFHALMAGTARRDGFLARPLEYFQRVWDQLGPHPLEVHPLEVLQGPGVGPAGAGAHLPAAGLFWLPAHRRGHAHLLRQQDLVRLRRQRRRAQKPHALLSAPVGDDPPGHRPWVRRIRSAGRAGGDGRR